MKAIYPGSFDPITNGHLDIIQRAAIFCSSLIIAVVNNPDKKSHFTLAQRLCMVKSAISNLKNVETIGFTGLVTDLAKEQKVDSLIRGMRDIGDFRLEWEAAQLNKIGGIETIFLMTNPNYTFISSSRIREIAKLGGNVAHWIPNSVQKYL